MNIEYAQYGLAAWMALCAIIMVKREKSYAGVMLAIIMIAGFIGFGWMSSSFDKVLPVEWQANVSTVDTWKGWFR